MGLYLGFNGGGAGGSSPSFCKGYSKTVLKYRGPILHVMSQALGSNDLSLNQSGTSIQILPEPNAVM